jgi:hypothetical protein
MGYLTPNIDCRYAGHGALKARREGERAGGNTNIC